MLVQAPVSETVRPTMPLAVLPSAQAGSFVKKGYARRDFTAVVIRTIVKAIMILIAIV